MIHSYGDDAKAAIGAADVDGSPATRRAYAGRVRRDVLPDIDTTPCDRRSLVAGLVRTVGLRALMPVGRSRLQAMLGQHLSLGFTTWATNTPCTPRKVWIEFSIRSRASELDAVDLARRFDLDRSTVRPDAALAQEVDGADVGGACSRRSSTSPSSMRQGRRPAARGGGLDVLHQARVDAQLVEVSTGSPDGGERLALRGWPRPISRITTEHGGVIQLSGL